MLDHDVGRQQDQECVRISEVSTKYKRYDRCRQIRKYFTKFADFASVPSVLAKEFHRYSSHGS